MINNASRYLELMRKHGWPTHQPKKEKPKESFQHYSVKITESRVFVWYVNSEGFVYKIIKSTITPTFSGSKIMLPGYVKNGFKMIKVRSKEYKLSHLVASKFIKGYYPGCCVNYKDNNKLNCNVENLFIYSKSEHGKNTGYRSKAKAVIIKKNGINKVYRSVREAAKAIYVSYQTLLDYLAGIYKTSVIDDLDLKIKYLE